MRETAACIRRTVGRVAALPINRIDYKAYRIAPRDRNPRQKDSETLFNRSRLTIRRSRDERKETQKALTHGIGMPSVVSV